VRGVSGVARHRLPLACEAARRERAARLHACKSAETDATHVDRVKPNPVRYGRVWSHDWPHGGIGELHAASGPGPACFRTHGREPNLRGDACVRGPKPAHLIALAIRLETVPPLQVPSLDSLSEREIAVLEAIAEGFTDAEIARQRGVHGCSPPLIPRTTGLPLSRSMPREARTATTARTPRRVATPVEMNGRPSSSSPASPRRPAGWLRATCSGRRPPLQRRAGVLALLRRSPRR
jgi:hypothetical protein